MGPIDYSLGNIPSPVDTFTQGLQRGFGMQQMEVQRQQQQIEMQAAQQAMAARQAQQAAMQELAAKASPTADDYRRAMIVAPQLSEQLKRGWDILNAEQQQSSLDQAGQAYAAIDAGRPEIAVESLRGQAAALKNSGAPLERVKAVEDMARLIEMDPATAKRSIGLRLATAPGGDKVFAALGAQGQEQRAAAKAPAELRQAEAMADKAGSDATTAAVTAKYADSQAVLDLEKKGWDIKAIVADMGFKKESNRIAAMNAAAAREGNALKREELGLKIEEAKSARDSKVREKVAAAESEAAAIDNGLNTIERFLNVAQDPKTKKPTSTLRAAAGPIDSRLPTTQTDVADLEGFIQTMKSQAFLTAVRQAGSMSGMTEKEGDKLESAILNLDLKQGADQILSNVYETQRIFLKARTSAEKKYGIPLGKPDTPDKRAAPTGGVTVSDW